MDPLHIPELRFYSFGKQKIFLVLFSIFMVVVVLYIAFSFLGKVASILFTWKEKVIYKDKISSNETTIKRKKDEERRVYCEIFIYLEEK
jgi:hypothetical protein